MLVPDGVRKSNGRHRQRLRAAPLALTLAAALGLGGAASGAAEPDPAPAVRFAAAYESLTTADFLAQKELFGEAADLYTEALNRLTRLAADHPDWQPDVVAYRIRYCRQALAALTARTRSDAAAPGGAPAATSVPPDTAASAPPADPEPILPPMAAGVPLGRNLEQAAALERAGNLQGALFLYMALLEDYPREPAALKGACRCALRLGMEENARALVRQAMTLPTMDAELSLLAALVACREGRFAAAIPLLRQSLQQDPRRAETHAALGVALAAVHQPDDAQQAMRRALSIDPRLGDAYYNLARLVLWRNPADLDTARVHYRNARRHGVPPDAELDRLLPE